MRRATSPTTRPSSPRDYDGKYTFKYDPNASLGAGAWGRLTEVRRAYRDSGGTLTEGSKIATMEYDPPSSPRDFGGASGLGRRTRLRPASLNLRRTSAGRSSRKSRIQPIGTVSIITTTMGSR